MLGTVPFAIANTNQLVTTEILNRETAATYNIQVRTCDTASPSQCLDLPFTVVVDDVNDAPVAVDDASNPPLVVVGNNAPVTIKVLANDTDQDGDTLTVNAVTQGANGGTVVKNVVDVATPRQAATTVPTASPTRPSTTARRK